MTVPGAIDVISELVRSNADPMFIVRRAPDRTLSYLGRVVGAAANVDISFLRIAVASGASPRYTEPGAFTLDPRLPSVLTYDDFRDNTLH